MKTKTSLADIRRDYTLGGLRRKDLRPDPIQQFQKWLEEAIKAEALEPTAMTLATVNKKGQPSARVVLLKALDARGFVFFTNYQSAKARDLAGNARAALNVHWRELERQVAICGPASKVSREESEAYFERRPLGSRLAAWASDQSKVIPNRQFLAKKLAKVEKRFSDGQVPTPPYWGGYVVKPETIEFWQGGASRLHDRFRYTRQSGGRWLIERLSP
jgi:pyridoxamine 5'-phosphate oxidase